MAKSNFLEGMSSINEDAENLLAEMGYSDNESVETEKEPLVGEEPEEELVKLRAEKKSPKKGKVKDAGKPTVITFYLSPLLRKVFFHLAIDEDTNLSAFVRKSLWKQHASKIKQMYPEQYALLEQEMKGL